LRPPALTFQIKLISGDFLKSGHGALDGESERFAALFAPKQQHMHIPQAFLIHDIYLRREVMDARFFPNQTTAKWLRINGLTLSPTLFPVSGNIQQRVISLGKGTPSASDPAKRSYGNEMMTKRSLSAKAIGTAALLDKSKLAVELTPATKQDPTNLSIQ
jgi:hypothetical protein